MGKRQNDSMHFRYSGNFYLTVLQKEQHKKCIIIIMRNNNTKNMQHFLQPRFSEEQVRKRTCLPLFFFSLNLPVEEEEVSNQNAKHSSASYYTSTMSTQPGKNFLKRESSATATTHVKKCMSTR